MKQYTVEQLQENLDDILREFQQDSSVELLQAGKPIAILVKPEVFERLQQSTQSTLWDAYQQFQQEVDLAEFEDDQEVFVNLRDSSLGRIVEL
jgi:antitoxin (DNA-binding transcriptional repressor) of toxin-antitoxin stability system